MCYHLAVWKISKRKYLSDKEEVKTKRFKKGVGSNWTKIVKVRTKK